MALGLGVPGGSVSEVKTLPSGHYWLATCLDMNNNDDYVQDFGRGE